MINLTDGTKKSVPAGKYQFFAVGSAGTTILNASPTGTAATFVAIPSASWATSTTDNIEIGSVYLQATISAGDTLHLVKID